MKVRVVSCGLSLSVNYGSDASEECLFRLLSGQIERVAVALQFVARELNITHGYNFPSRNLVLDSFDEWLPIVNGVYDEELSVLVLGVLDTVLEKYDIDCCTFNCPATLPALKLIPNLLKVSSRFYSNVSLMKSGELVEQSFAQAAADTVIQLSRIGKENLHSYQFCATFNCQPNCPFPPTSYHVRGNGPIVSVGLECGDLLFLAFHGVTDLTAASSNLESAYLQMLRPLEDAISEACASCGVIYGGIDPSMHPGRELYDSVGKGLEELYPHRTGAKGFLASVATVSRAISSLHSTDLRLCGLGGLFLPVMEDVVLADRAGEETPALTLGDALACSSAGAVGIDSVPLPGGTTTHELCGLYLDVGAVAHSLNKPMFCRYTRSSH